MKTNKLHFHFHNPNPPGILEKELEKLLVKNGTEKLLLAFSEKVLDEKKRGDAIEDCGLLQSFHR